LLLIRIEAIAFHDASSSATCIKRFTMCGTWCDGNKQITRLERVKHFVEHHACAHQAEQ
jgi:hypothetical protein